ncbi:MAG: peptidylprolyl isomerase [Bacteroidia bacterium]
MKILKISTLALTLLLATNILPAQKSSSPILLSFPKKEDVNKAEFERVYQKNNGGYDAAAKHSPQQYREYLNLYINFKRKVFEAEELGLDKTSAFQAEYNSYKKQLAQPYMGAKEAEEKLIQEAYNRSLTSVSANHLLVKVEELAPAEDTLIAYNKCLAYRDSVIKGKKSFEEMAEKYSEDPSAKDNKGALGYFNVFDMVYPFENGAYNTAVGQISMPIRSRFGYHLIKVNDKVKNEGSKRVSHIIIRVGDRYSAKDSSQAIAKINELYDKLKGGSDFAELARNFSDDPNTASKGGDLGDGRLRPELENYKMKLGKGEYSAPFKTAFGWHILRVTDAKTPSTLETMRTELKRKIERDSRSQLSKQALIERIKRENKVTINRKNFDTFKAKLTPEFIKGTWGKKDYKDSADLKLEAYNLLDGKKTVSVAISDYVAYYLKNKGLMRAYSKMSPQQAADALLTRFIDEQMLQFEEDHLADKNPDYKALLKEYRDGILLFSLMEQKVWKKAVEDSVGLKKYYTDNAKTFQADEMIDVREYRSPDEAVLKQVEELMAQGNDEKFIDSVMNSQSALKLRITTQTFEKGKTESAAKMFGKNVGERSEITKEGESYKIWIVEKKFPAGIKPFEKAKSECITKYQDQLEKDWLKALEAKYPVKVNEKTFGKLYKK